MDLSVYISELLNEQGAINIPQMGVFKQVRMRGHYNADEGKLYPPYFQTQFEYKPVDDDSLLQYIISKSKVSATSAKYFLDRYLHNILQQAEIGEAMLGRLGWIAKDGDKLIFRAAPTVTANSAAFGFAPVSINAEPKAEAEHTPPAIIPEEPVAAKPVSVEPPAPVTATPVAPLPIFSVEKTAGVLPEPAHTTQKAAPLPLVRPAKTQTTQPVPAITTQEPQAPVEEFTDRVHPFYAKPWFFGLVVGLVVLALIIILYPRPEGKSTAHDTAAPMPSTAPVVVKQPETAEVKPADTAVAKITVTTAQPTKTGPAKPLPASTEYAPEVESPAQPAKPVLINTNNYHFALMSGAFSTEEEAERVVKRYKVIHIEAAIIKNISRSRYFKVTLGFFKTYAEGKAAKNKLIKDKHLRERDLYVETLKRKKK